MIPSKYLSLGASAQVRCHRRHSPQPLVFFKFARAGQQGSLKLANSTVLTIAGTKRMMSTSTSSCSVRTTVGSRCDTVWNPLHFHQRTTFVLVKLKRPPRVGEQITPASWTSIAPMDPTHPGSACLSHVCTLCHLTCRRRACRPW